MKKSLLSAAALALVISAGTALAADLPSRKMAPVYVPPPPPPLWTGFYVGLNAGGTFGGDNSSTVSGGPIAVFNATNASFNATSAIGATISNPSSSSNGGFIGGGQIGYNFQTNNFVWGIEADIQGLAGSNNTTSASASAPVLNSLDVWNGTVSTTKSLDYLGTVRGRIGFLFTPTLLIYGTGGLAYGGANSSSSFSATDTLFTSAGVFTGSSQSDTLVGWTAGGGLEWLFAPHWSAKLEYLYYDLGTLSGQPGLGIATTPAGVAYGAIAVQNNTSFNGHIVRAGVNYHFNWAAPAPVVAKY
jgi:outer membrane immunogenic protein